jgi:pimeloyl-ACP methyl ester carboxylesterase
MLLQAVSFDPAQARRPTHAEVLAGDRRPRRLRLADGRRLAVVEYGDRRGRPVLWLQSAIGLFEPTPAGEREMIRRGLRIVVPIRAGYATSDPAPPGEDMVEVAARDCAEVLRLAGIDRCPVVSFTYEIRIALALARVAPDKVERIVAVSSMFPIRNIAHFRRLNTIGRFYVATVRYAPHLLPFILRAWHADMRRNGVHASIRKVYRDTPSDTRAFADAATAKAMTSAYGLLYAADPAASQAAFCAEAVRFERPWPEGTGEVGCPVTLMHGQEDGSSPYATALDYCASFPSWRCIGYPGEGQLVGFTRLHDLLALIEAQPVPAVASA